MEHYLKPLTVEEDHQLSDDEQYRYRLRAGGPDAWSNKNGGACAYCGGHDGMISLRRYMFIDAPPAENEVFYAGGQGMYEPCPECNPASVIVSYYRRMAHAEAVAWASAQEDSILVEVIQSNWVDPMATYPTYTSLQAELEADYRAEQEQARRPL